MCGNFFLQSMSGLRSRESSTATPSPSGSIDLDFDSFTRGSSLTRLGVDLTALDGALTPPSSPRPHTAARSADPHEPLWPIALVGCLLIAVVGVALGVASNQNDSKYIRLVAQDGCKSSWKNIAAVAGSTAAELKCCTSAPHPFDHSTFDHSAPKPIGLDGRGLASAAGNSRVTSAESGGAQWDSVCASNYRMEAALSTLWGAWLVPLLPLAFSGLAGVGSSRSRYGYIGGGRRAGWAFSLRARLCGYVLLMVVRTTLLYGGLNLAEDWAEARGWFGPRDDACGYAHLRRSGACKEPWDAADHVVLLTVNPLMYLYSCTMESNRLKLLRGIARAFRRPSSQGACEIVAPLFP